MVNDFECEKCGFSTKTALKFCPRCRNSTWKTAKAPQISPIAQIKPSTTRVVPPVTPAVTPNSKLRGQLPIIKPGWMLAIFMMIALSVAGIIKSTEGLATVLANHTSLATELAMAEGLLSEVERETPPLAPSHPDSLLLQSIAQRLVAAVPSDSRYKTLYSFKVIKSDDVNAFAVPGGAIYFYTGLLDLVGRDPALIAAVMAHEIHHVEQRHGLKGVYQRQSLLAAVVWTFGLASDFGFATAAAIIGTRHSRKLESEADLLGYQLLRDAGLDTQAMPQMLRKLALAKRGITLPQWLNNHPDPERRAEAIEGLK